MGSSTSTLEFLTSGFGSLVAVIRVQAGLLGVCDRVEQYIYERTISKKPDTLAHEI
jgi:hypothetical protein